MTRRSIDPSEVPALRELLTQLDQAEPLAVLATADEDGPYCCLVGFALSADLKEGLFCTPRDSRKARNIVSNPNVSLLMDNRTRRASDFRDGCAVTVAAQAVEVDPSRLARLTERYLEKHPTLKDFVEDPQTALIHLQIQRYAVVQNFQDVLEWSP
jgi:uncharacterized pyridoxamine 5'-phosphate oxidase family protein